MALEPEPESTEPKYIWCKICEENGKDSHVASISAQEHRHTIDEKLDLLMTHIKTEHKDEVLDVGIPEDDAALLFIDMTLGLDPELLFFAHMDMED